MVQIGESVATLATPLEHLVACHRRLEQRLATFVKAGAELEAKPQQAMEAIASAIRFMDTNGAWHTEDEEESVFPRLKPYLTAQETTFVERLQAEHLEAEELYVALKSTVPELPGAKAAYLALAAQMQAIYRGHIQAEEEILLALARRDLQTPELDAIAVEMRARRFSITEEEAC